MLVYSTGYLLSTDLARYKKRQTRRVECKNKEYLGAVAGWKKERSLNGVTALCLPNFLFTYIYIYIYIVGRDLKAG
jgi:hypothetical protein